MNWPNFYWTKSLVVIVDSPVMATVPAPTDSRSKPWNKRNENKTRTQKPGLMLLDTETESHANYPISWWPLWLGWPLGWLYPGALWCWHGTSQQVATGSQYTHVSSQAHKISDDLWLLRGNDTHHSGAGIHEDLCSCPVSLSFFSEPFSRIFSLIQPVITQHPHV